MLKKYSLYNKSGVNLFELLLALAIVSALLYPMMIIIRTSKSPLNESPKELLATFLAHHVMEKIIAKKSVDYDYLPRMNEEEPLVDVAGSVLPVSQFFRHNTGEKLISPSDEALYDIVRNYKCKIDTYYLENSMYKVIVYISFIEENTRKRVFLTRILPRTDSRNPFDRPETNKNHEEQ